jgi:ATP synthase protein I
LRAFGGGFAVSGRVSIQGRWARLSGHLPMGENDPGESLKELGDRLDRARRAQRPVHGPQAAGTNDALAKGWRVSIELLAAIAVGGFVGWAVDKGLGTRPWGMIIFFVLGIAAGMWNVYRAVTGLGMAVGFRRGSGGSDAPGDWPGNRNEDED